MPSSTQVAASPLQDGVDQTLVAALPDHESGAVVDTGRGRGVGSVSGGGKVPEESWMASKSASDDKTLKRVARSAHSLTVVSGERAALWRGLYRRREGEEGVAANGALYWETVKTCFGSKELPTSCPPLPALLEPAHTHMFCLKPSGRISVTRIVTCFAYNQPDIQYCPVLFSVAAVFRHYLSEEDSYGLLSSLAASRVLRFFSQGRMQAEIDWRAILELNKQYNKRSVAQLQAESSAQDFELLCHQWLWWIFDYLPLTHVTRIMDCFLVEGHKILFRVSLSLVRCFAKCIRSSPEWSGAISREGLILAFTRFCKEIPFSPKSLLERCFRIRQFSRSQLHALALTLEIDIKAKGFNSFGGGELGSECHPEAGASSDLLFSKQGAPKNPSTFPIKELTTEILTQDDLVTLWQWLPDRVTTVTPSLAYSSAEHGISLTTFYTRAENYEQTILVVKTTKGELFGAYCSTAWAERKYKDDRGQRQTYFGNGETFLFTLASSAPSSKNQRFRWVGLEDGAGHGSAADSGLSKAEQHARELFMSGQTDMIAIGGGNGNGLFIDASMTHGKTERCATFDNPPLCANGDFQIASVEVFGLNKLEL